MQVSVQSGEGLECRMTVELPAEEITNAVESRLAQIARTARLDGFRPGKVPLRIVRQRFGAQVQDEVFGERVQASFGQAVTQEKLRPAGVPSIQPEIDQTGGKFAYTAVFEVLPQIELAPLAGATVKRPVAEVTDADLDDMIERLRRQRQTWSDVERPAQDGDRLRISFKGMLDGTPFEGGDAKDVPLVLGSGRMIEGFESGLVGASAGETRTLEVTFPDDYRAEHLAGKAATFEVEVHGVAEPVLPEVDAEFARTFGVEDGDIDKLRADVRGNMEREMRQRIESKLKNAVMDVLLDAHKIDLPKVLVDEEVENLLQQTRQNVAGGNFELPRNLFEDQARRRVALGLIVAEVVKTQGIRPDPQRVRATVEEMAASYEDPQEVVDHYYANRELLSSVENLALENQVVDWVLGQVQVDEVPSTFKEVTGEGE